MKRALIAFASACVISFCLGGLVAAAEIKRSPEVSPTITPNPEPGIRLLDPLWIPEAGDPEEHARLKERDAEINMLARTVWGEARGCAPDEQALVVWTVLQRVNDSRWPDSIRGVVTQPRQFNGYKESNPILPEIHDICATELMKWEAGVEPPIHEVYAPSAPYYFYEGDGRHNTFRESWRKNAARL